jgi:hypothetical protein
MEGPDDLGQYVSVLFRADLSEVLGEPIYGLYMLEGDGPPMVLVPSGADDRFVLGVPLPPDVDEAAVRVMFPPERCVAMIRAAAGRPDLGVEILATNTFAFSAQVAERWRAGRAFLVGDAAHRMTPRGGRGMNTAIADAFDLGWKLAWVVRGLAAPALLDTYEAERSPIGRRNVALSVTPGNGGSDDGLAEDLGAVEAFPPDGRPGSRAPHAWLRIGSERISTLDLFGRGLVLLTAGDAAPWRAAVAELAASGNEAPIRVRSVGRYLRDDEGGFAAAYGLADGGAVLVRPDGIVAARWPSATTEHLVALAAAVNSALGFGSAEPAGSAAADAEAA